MRQTFVETSEDSLLDDSSKNNKYIDRCKFFACCMVSSGMIMSLGFIYIYKIQEDGSDSDIINFLPGLV